ncbi:MAG TPA: FhaA domain-containing protein [Candidatus Tumulicola sp.]
MSIFEKIEQACAAFIERAFAKTFPSDLEPAQIARKLVSTMEARTRDEDGRLVAPGNYAVGVNPEDFERLASHQAYLEREWADLLRELAGRVGIGFLEGDAKVRMTARESVPLGAVDVAVAGEPARAAAAARERFPRFHLRMIKGVSALGVYSIEGTVRIGRGDENEILLADRSVSRTHAVVETAGPQPVVRDLGSTNGTFVNGERVRERGLRDGDELMFGNTRMRFEVSGE